MSSSVIIKLQEDFTKLKAEVETVVTEMLKDSTKMHPVQFNKLYWKCVQDAKLFVEKTPVIKKSFCLSVHLPILCKLVYKHMVTGKKDMPNLSDLQKNK